MKIIWWSISLVALSAALLVSLQLHAGYALIVVPPWRIEVSLPTFGIGLLLFLLILNLSMALLAKVWRIPTRIRHYHDQRVRIKARSALTQGLIAYFGNESARAEKWVAQAIKSPEDRAICLMLGALSAHESQQPTKRDHYLALSQEEPTLQTTVAAVQARLRFPNSSQVPDGTKGSE
ncbi:MAG: hypothetical protein M0Z78_01210 [Betaproteobacteria bacterium]|jgi:Uncharacterized enzyme of heme biosynthesis|nr:hypothetical protein [Betaproteobacteria bacterium]